MAATFEVHRAFALDGRGLLALVGEIRDGTVHTGMLASLEERRAGSFQERVHGVEYLDLPGAEGRPALTFHYRDPAKLERWLDLGWEGRVLHLGF